MKRLLVGVVLVAAALVVVLMPGSVSADINLTQTHQVALSCTDGHSVILGVDSTTLSSLTADVAAINADGTGTSCSLNTTASVPPSGTAKWTVYDYNPSGQEIAPRNSPNSRPATTSGTTTIFDFLPGAFTALLTTTDKSLTGDLSSKTLTDTISLNGPATTFMTQHNGGNCVSNVPAAVRFFFVSPSASGKSTATGAGFYTRFWWSNPVHMDMVSGSQSQLISADVGNPAEWSDWNGKSGADPTAAAAFLEAAQHVQTVGLSFGGDCFFETGVQAEYPAGSPPPYEMFSSNFSES